MTQAILVLTLALSSNFGWGQMSSVAGVQLHHLLLQGRIVLKSGPGGGVTVKPDPYVTNRSYNHSSRPLFSSQTAHAARRSTSRYTPAAPQLITSREVARESVYRSVIGGRRWGW